MWVSYPEVFPDTQMVRDTFPVQILQPVFPYKLTISHKALDGRFTEKANESIHYLLAFFGIGVSPFGKQSEKKKELQPLYK